MKKSNYLLIGFFIVIIFITPFAGINLISKANIPFIISSENNKTTQFTKNKNKYIDKLNSNYFIENKGQIAEETKYYTKYNDLVIEFSNSKINYHTPNNEFQVMFQGANNVSPKSIDCLESVSNYYTNDLIISNVHHYKRIIFENLYEGISLIYKYTSLGLKYDFIVEPFANIEQIAIVFKGLDELQIKTKTLSMFIGDSLILDDKLEAWYEPTRKPIAIEFNKKVCLNFDNIVSFSVMDSYDRSQRIIIDPLICTFSTFYGGSDAEHSTTAGDHGEIDIFVDDDGYIYYTGQSFSTDFATANAFQTTPNGEGDVTLLKMTPDGQSIVFATLIGGSEWDIGTCVNVDSLGNVVLLGVTFSLDFPILNAFQEIHGGDETQKDVFISRFNSTGGLLSSTYFGGSRYDYPYGVVIDNNDNIIYCGGSDSSDFYTKNAYQSIQNGSTDITLTKFTSNCQSVVFSTLYGGNGGESAMDIVQDSEGNFILTGFTVGDNFPTKNAYQSHINGGFGSFIVKFDSSGSLLFATTIDGASYDKGLGIDVDAQDNIVITGGTLSVDFPVANATQTTLAGNEDIFILKLSANGQRLLYSTFLGGGGGEEGQDIKVDSEGNMVVVGLTTSYDFPIVHAFQDLYTGNSDACIVIAAPNGTLLSSSYLGGNNMDKASGLSLDSNDSLIIGGWTSSSNFPTVNPFQSSKNGVNDLFVAKLYLDLTASTVITTTQESQLTIQALFLFISLIGGCFIFRERKKK